MFEKFPRAPLATFLWIMRMRRMPTETEFELILQSIKEGVDFFLDLSHEIAGLTVSENSKDTSKVELISDVEMRFLSKRKKVYYPKLRLEEFWFIGFSKFILNISKP